VVQASVRPRGAYSLALSAQLAGDATRRFADGRFTAVVAGATAAERAEAWQLPDGTVRLRAPSEQALERLRFQLALDADHAEFLRRFGDDALIGRAVRELRGLRPLRLGSVTHALLRAFCGQLIDAGRARSIERRVVRAATVAVGGLHAPPAAADLARFSPAELRRLGLHARRSAALVRICRELDPESLHGSATEAAARRLERERGVGPWSVGVVCLEGLGRHERGLVGDLGLVRLLGALRGRRVEGWETAELLEPYGEWAGLASVYMLKGASRGLVPAERGLWTRSHALGTPA
jgi:AraC family transcriptional regulator of adaptative response / DNA-3-methyladenine glycosylase II